LGPSTQGDNKRKKRSRGVPSRAEKEKRLLKSWEEGVARRRKKTVNIEKDLSSDVKEKGKRANGMKGGGKWQNMSRDTPDWV